MWAFSNNSHIGEFTTSYREPVFNVKFNNFGDKIGGVDTQGNFYLWKLNK